MIQHPGVIGGAPAYTRIFYCLELFGNNKMTAPMTSSYFKDLNLDAGHFSNYRGETAAMVFAKDDNGEVIEKRDGKPWIECQFGLPSMTIGYNDAGPYGDSTKSWKEGTSKSTHRQNMSLSIEVPEKIKRAMPHLKEDLPDVRPFLEELQERLLRKAFEIHPKYKKKQSDTDFEKFKAKAQNTLFKDQINPVTGEEESMLYLQRRMYTTNKQKEGEFNDNKLRYYRKQPDGTWAELNFMGNIPYGSVVKPSIQVRYWQTSSGYGVHAWMGRDLIIISQKKTKKRQNRDDDKVAYISDSDDEDSEPAMKRSKTA